MVAAPGSQRQSGAVAGTAGGAMEAVGGSDTAVVCTCAVPTAVVVLGETVQKARLKGKNRATVVAGNQQPPGESSRVAAAASGGSKPTRTAAGSMAAITAKRSRLAMMTQNPEVGTGKSSQFAGVSQAPLEWRPRRSVVGADTESEEEKDSEGDQDREEISGPE